MISVTIGRSVLNSYETIADRELRLERALATKHTPKISVMVRLRTLLSSKTPK